MFAGRCGFFLPMPACTCTLTIPSRHCSRNAVAEYAQGRCSDVDGFKRLLYDLTTLVIDGHVPASAYAAAFANLVCGCLPGCLCGMGRPWGCRSDFKGFLLAFAFFTMAPPWVSGSEFEGLLLQLRKWSSVRTCLCGMAWYAMGTSHRLEYRRSPLAMGL